MFDWKEDFQLGITSLDDQHKTLFAIGNQLDSLIKNHQGDLYDEIVSVLNEMREYTLFHFAEEEDMMRKAGYPGLDDHKREHDKFIDYLDNIDLDALDGDQVGHIKQLSLFIAKWIFKHISYEDFKYKDVLKSM